MSRKTDLEGHIRDSYRLIREYEKILRLSADPKEQARSRDAVEEQWELIKGYLAEYVPLCKRLSLATPEDIAEIAVTAGVSLPSASSAQPPSNFIHAPSTPPNQQGKNISTAALRDLLTAAFSDEELMALCYDHFRPVHEQFSGGMSKPQKIQRLIEHCERHRTLDQLLTLVREHNSAQFTRFEAQLGLN